MAWPQGDGVLDYLGYPLDRDHNAAQAVVGSFAAAEDWTQQQALVHHQILIVTRRLRRWRYLINRLLGAGIPGTAYWIHDGTFAATIASERSESLSN